MKAYLLLPTAILLLAIAYFPTFFLRCEKSTELISPEFKKCRTQALVHHDKCLYWYTAREDDCADALEREVQICHELFPPLGSESKVR